LIQAKGGKISGRVYVVKDLRERKALEAEKQHIAETQKILSEASNLLAESIDFETTLEHVLQVIVPKLGDCCFLHIYAKEGEREHLKSVCLRPEFDARIRAYSEHVTRSKHSLVVESVAEAGQTELSRLGVSSYIVCPLINRGESLGSLTVLSTHPDRLYDSRDLADFGELARRAAMAIENSKLYHEAQEAILSRDEFLSIASHELRTPLTALQLQLQIFSREIARNFDSHDEPASVQDPNKNKFLARALRIVRSCENQSMKLTSLLDELLDLTRIRLGKLQLSKEIVDLSAVVNSVVEQFRAELAQKGIPISVNTPESVKSFLDPMRVEQIVSNLISNAVKYGGGSPIRVLLEVDEHTSRSKLVVSDEGIGIHPQMRDRIFERFERAGVSGKKIAGLGLGLYICRQIVEAHGGTIRVESNVGHGSSFIVDLPLAVSGDVGQSA
jgi:signal transduction histidine kinase